MIELEYRTIPKVTGYLAGSDGFIYSLFIGSGKGSYISESPQRRIAGGLDGKKKYLHVSVIIEGTRRIRNVHNLIASAFLGELPDKTFQVSHLDGDSTNNVPSNLVYEKAKDNHFRKKMHGTDDTGSRNSRAVFNQKDIEEILFLRNNLKWSQQRIADKFGVSRTSVLRVVNKKRYNREIKNAKENYSG